MNQNTHILEQLLVSFCLHWFIFFETVREMHRFFLWRWDEKSLVIYRVSKNLKRHTQNTPPHSSSWIASAIHFKDLSQTLPNHATIVSSHWRGLGEVPGFAEHGGIAAGQSGHSGGFSILWRVASWAWVMWPGMCQQRERSLMKNNTTWCPTVTQAMYTDLTLLLDHNSCDVRCP